MQVPDRFYRKFANADLKLRARNPAQEDVAFTRAALAMCENIDWNVGRILDRLDELKLADHTIVLYFSDNGPNGWRWNGGMKGRKGSTDEGGVRAPFLIRWPGHIPAGARIPQIAGAIDLLPTLADLAGIPVASTKPLDGISLKPLLLGTAQDWPDRMIFSHWNGKVSVRTQRYRLDDSNHLFDMEADPGQDHDFRQPQARGERPLVQGAGEVESGAVARFGRRQPPLHRGLSPVPHHPTARPRWRAARQRPTQRQRAELLLSSRTGSAPTTASPGTWKSPRPASTKRSSTTPVRQRTSARPSS